MGAEIPLGEVRSIFIAMFFSRNRPALLQCNFAKKAPFTFTVLLHLSSAQLIMAAHIDDYWVLPRPHTPFRLSTSMCSMSQYSSSPFAPFPTPSLSNLETIGGGRENEGGKKGRNETVLLRTTTVLVRYMWLINRKKQMDRLLEEADTYCL